MRLSFTTGWLKFLVGWAAVFLFRLIPFRPPNFEPMLATVMPFSKRFGILGSFLFGVIGIALFDSVTSGWGVWTAVTALCYGLLGIGAHLFFKNRDATAANFLLFGVPATILYDAVTMLIGPLFNNQTWVQALVGQVPFTLLHLAGTVVFTTVLSPALYRWVAHSETAEFSYIWRSAVAALRS